MDRILMDVRDDSPGAAPGFIRLTWTVSAAKQVTGTTSGGTLYRRVVPGVETRIERKRYETREEGDRLLSEYRSQLL